MTGINWKYRTRRLAVERARFIAHSLERARFIAHSLERARFIAHRV